MLVDKDGAIVEWLDMRSELKEALEGLSFEKTIQQWDDWETQFSELEGGRYYVDWVRSMILVDRYFLLINVLLPEKIKKIALSPWLFGRCREVEANPDGYLDLWAREHFKTSVITHAGCIQEILRDPEVTIAIFSHTKAVAKKILVQIKNDLQNNETLKTCFPDILYKNPQKESPLWTLEKFTVKRKDSPREATCEAHGIVDGQPTGAHFKLRVYDDLVTAESVSTPEQIAKTTDMLALSDNLGTQGGRVRFIGTRYALGDTYEHMIDKGQVQVRIYPATKTGRLDGEPVFFSKEYWEEKKRSQTMATLACQMLQNPNAGSQAMFNILDLRFYAKRPALLNVYILADPASSMKKGSDKTAMAVIGIDGNLNKFLLDGFHHRMGLQEKWRCLRHLVTYWSSRPGVQQVFVGYEKYGAQSDIEYMKLEMEKTGAWFDIAELNTPRQGNGSKRDRMSRLDPDFRSHKLYLPCLVTEEGVVKEIKLIKNLETQEPALAKRAVTEQFIQANPLLRDREFSVKPIKRLNEEKRVYDLTLDFIRQAQNVPNDSSHDDLVDAVSRIYDMDIIAPRHIPGHMLLPPSFSD